MIMLHFTFALFLLAKWPILLPSVHHQVNVMSLMQKHCQNTVLLLNVFKLNRYHMVVIVYEVESTQGNKSFDTVSF